MTVQNMDVIQNLLLVRYSTYLNIRTWLTPSCNAWRPLHHKQNSNELCITHYIEITNLVRTSNELNPRIGNKHNSLLILLQEEATRLGLP